MMLSLRAAVGRFPPRLAAILSVPAVLTLLAIPVVARAADDVINPGTRAWVQAARTGRADMLVLGDSVVWHNGDGWDAGINRAFAGGPLGLAGTGLGAGLGGIEGDGFSFSAGGDWSADPARVPASRRGYGAYGFASSVGPAGTGSGFRPFGLRVEQDAIPSGGRGYDWHVYAAAPAGGGSTGYYYRDGSPPYGVRARVAAVPVATPAGPGLQRLTVRFAEPPADVAGLPREFNLDAPADMTAFYSRATVPGKTGATVTSWGLGGVGTRDFVTAAYRNENTMTAAGRQSWLDAMVYDGSGKLNVLIAEGFNDRNDGRLSVGTNPAVGNTPAGFRDNVEALIAAVRGDWQALGRDRSDLSFTLVGMYRDGFEPGDRSGKLWAFGDALAAAAAADPQVSYVGLWDKGPSYQDAVARGYFVRDGPGFDPVHPSRAGALAYSDLVVDALLVPVPEPAGLAVVGLAAAGLLARRPRRRTGTSRDLTAASSVFRFT